MKFGQLISKMDFEIWIGYQIISHIWISQFTTRLGVRTLDWEKNENKVLKGQGFNLKGKNANNVLEVTIASNPKSKGL